MKEAACLCTALRDMKNTISHETQCAEIWNNWAGHLTRESLGIAVPWHAGNQGQIVSIHDFQISNQISNFQVLIHFRLLFFKFNLCFQFFHFSISILQFSVFNFECSVSINFHMFSVQKFQFFHFQDSIPIVILHLSILVSFQLSICRFSPWILIFQFSIFSSSMMMLQPQLYTSMPHLHGAYG